MRPVTVSCVIDRPREEVFDYLADIANHAEFSAPFARHFRLERLQSRGVGAAARFRFRPPLSLWAELILEDLDHPYRILATGRAGRIGRIPIKAEFILTEHDRGMTQVQYTFSSEPAAPADRLRESLGGRSGLRRQLARALQRLRQVLEEGEPSAHAATVAAG